MKKLLWSVTAGLCLASLAFTGVQAAPSSQKTTKNSFDAQQTKDIQAIVKDYLINNPEILPQMAMELRVKQAMEQEKKQTAALSKDYMQIFKDPNTPSAGSKNPTVYVAEFFDYQCGHCKRMLQPVDNILKNNKNVRFLFKEFPIFGKNSEYAARVALAANLQGKYWPVHEALLATSNPLTEAKALAAAKTAGVNMRQLKRDINSAKVSAVLAQSKKLADNLGLQGTPAFVFAKKGMSNMKLVPGAMDEKGMQAMIDETKAGKAKG